MPIIDPHDPVSTTSRLLIARALSKLTLESLFNLLCEREPMVRTAAAREIQIRGGKAAFARAAKLCESRKRMERGIGAFIVGQLGTPGLPFQKEGMDVLSRMIEEERSEEVMECVLYAMGHLRKGKPLRKKDLQIIVDSVARRPSKRLREAARFAKG